MMRSFQKTIKNANFVSYLARQPLCNFSPFTYAHKQPNVHRDNTPRKKTKTKTNIIRIRGFSSSSTPPRPHLPSSFPHTFAFFPLLLLPSPAPLPSPTSPLPRSPSLLPFPHIFPRIPQKDAVVLCTYLCRVVEVRRVNMTRRVEEGGDFALPRPYFFHVLLLCFSSLLLPPPRFILFVSLLAPPS